MRPTRAIRNWSRSIEAEPCQVLKFETFHGYSDRSFSDSDFEEIAVGYCHLFQTRAG